MQIDIAGKVREKKLASNKALLPLFEAIVNSIHAIEDREMDSPGLIEIEAERSKQTQAEVEEDEKPQIIGFKITDNGIGFTKENWESFNFAHSSYKLHKGGKGIGRITWLRAFSKVEIESIFRKNGSTFCRTFDFLLTRDGIENHKIEEIDGSSRNQTKVYLKNLNFNYHRWTNNNWRKLLIRL